jgi:hypothetical protein
MHLVLLVFAFVFALLAAAKVEYPRVHFGWLAIACWIATLFLVK